MTPQAMVQIGYLPARIDLLTSIDGVTFGACFTNRVEVKISRTSLRVISVDDLIRNKLAMGRAKNLADVEMFQRNANDESTRG